METEFLELTGEQRARLEGMVDWGSFVVRAVLFFLVVLGICWFFRYVHGLLERHLPWFGENQWVVPALVCTLFLYCISRKWTGGRRQRRRIRADLIEGKVRLITIEAVECIEVTEREDEGPGYFVKDKSGRTVFFAGQYLLDYERKGFPWTRIGIVEAARSKEFFGLEKLGEPLEPSFVREPLTREEFYDMPDCYEQYGFIDVPFENFKVLSCK